MFHFFKKPKLPPNCLVALSAKELLAPYLTTIQQIHQQVGVPESHWKAVYTQFICNFAEQVQLLPASESHHHAQLGGLLSHSLEVGLHALKFRKSKMLPLGAAVDEIERQKERWSYAIFTAAVLHDIGKIHTDQKIHIIQTTANNHAQIQWTPLTETLATGTFYKISYQRKRQYHAHQTIALLFASKLLPKSGLNWIASNAEILTDWTNYLTGNKQHASALSELVTQADKLSTAQSLTGSENISLSSSATVPLHQRLLTSLIYLLYNNELPLNRAGAAGWVYNNNLWLVSKWVLDKIRSQMIEEGQSGIPSDNTRLIGENKDLILVSPVIFRKYANQNNTTYQQVQHDFQSLNLHKITHKTKISGNLKPSANAKTKRAIA